MPRRKQPDIAEVVQEAKGILIEGLTSHVFWSGDISGMDNYHVLYDAMRKVGTDLYEILYKLKAENFITVLDVSDEVRNSFKDGRSRTRKYYTFADPRDILKWRAARG